MSKLNTEIGETGILHPAHGGRFSVRAVAHGSELSSIRIQTTSYAYDINKKTVCLTIEVPQQTGALEEDLSQFCDPFTKKFIVIEYLDGSSLRPQRTVHCDIKSITSCKFKNSYASSGICTVKLKCRVKTFIVSP